MERKKVMLSLIMEMENFVFLREGNKVMAGGYEIDNKFMREGMPAISNIKKGGGSLDTLAVPAGLFLLQQHATAGPSPFILTQEDASVIPDNLYDKLLSLMTTGEKKKRLTRRSKSKGRRRTRKKR